MQILNGENENLWRVGLNCQTVLKKQFLRTPFEYLRLEDPYNSDELCLVISQGAGAVEGRAV